MENKKGIVFAIGCLIYIMGFIMIASATQTTLGEKKAGDTIQLIQSCASCTYENISHIIYPTGSIQYLGEVEMTQNGTIWNYTWASPKLEGTYLIVGHDDEDGTDEEWEYWITLTMEGEDTDKGINNISIYIIIATIIALFVHTKVSRFFGSMMIMLLGFGMLFTISGFGWIGWTVIGSGFIMMIYALMAHPKKKFRR